MLKENKNPEFAKNSSEEYFGRLGSSPFILEKAKKAKDLLAKVNLPRDETVVEKIAKNAKITKDQASNALDTFIAVLESTINKDDKVSLSEIRNISGVKLKNKAATRKTKV